MERSHWGEWQCMFLSDQIPSCHEIINVKVLTPTKDTLGPYGTDGRLFATDGLGLLQSHVTQKLGQI